MEFISTRGEAPVLGFQDAVLTGLARDGGLYVPKTFPKFEKQVLRNLQSRSYVDIAETVLSPFIDGEISPSAFRSMLEEAYGTFAHSAVAPLVQTRANEFVLELFHGPTLAFKDVAMQLLARVTDNILDGRDEHVTIVGATSGDTGSAAIEAFRGRSNSDIFIMFPNGRVSDVQRRQMTTIADANVHALAIEGDFDDCQALLKEMFNDLAFRDQMALSGVNSINWGRIMPQIVYYFSAALSLGAPDRTVDFTVPTGNFGDIFAGYIAMKMGLPIGRLIIATNDNDILHRTLTTGRYEMRSVFPTTSPSMDIQISSNFERLLFDASGNDADYIRRSMNQLKQSGSFDVPSDTLEAISSTFTSGRASTDEVEVTIQETFAESGYLSDPHTAAGVKVARENTGENPMVILSTAHPAKFPAAVKQASGVNPPLPDHLSDLMQREERFTVLPNSLTEVEAFIKQKSRR